MFARLEIAIEEIVVIGEEQKFGEAREINFKRLLVKGNSRKTEEVVLEVVQIPGNGLTVETRSRIANLVVQVAAGFDLKTAAKQPRLCGKPQPRVERWYRRSDLH